MRIGRLWPLAVISTSAQQLARNLGAPPEKNLTRSHNIRAAVRRLIHLVDDYLADDRLAEPAAAPHKAPCDLHIDVTNPATAIPPSEQNHLFERYWRGASTQRGTGAGLGLYLVRRIAEKLGASVALVSAGGDQPVCLQLDLPIEDRSQKKSI